MKMLGLTAGEIKVYCALLHNGTCGLNLIHEKTGLERRGIYDILNRLVEKGLVTYTVENKKRKYQCAPPGRILEETKRRTQDLHDIEKMVPEMESLFNSVKQEINFEIFRGKEGIKAVFDNMLNYTDNYFIGGKWYVAQKMPAYWKHYNKRRIEKRVWWNNLLTHDAPRPPTTKFLRSRALPKEFSGSPVVVFIYGDKVANVVWGENFFAFVMESKEIADNYRRYFKYLWNKVAR